MLSSHGFCLSWLVRTWGRRFRFPIGRFRSLWNPGNKTPIVFQASAYCQTFGGDLVLANVFAVVAAAHLDHHDDFAKPAFDLDVAQSDNVVSQKRDRMRAKEEIGK